MTDYIDRQAALDALAWKWAGKAALDAIKELPPAQVEPVVRCKDCKHRYAEDGFCKGRGWPMQLVPDDGFCDKGERSEE